MADALKAEGNKLFAEKKFAESMQVPRKVEVALPYMGALLTQLQREVFTGY